MQAALFKDFAVPFVVIEHCLPLSHEPQADCPRSAFHRIDHCDEDRDGARHRAGAQESTNISGVHRTKVAHWASPSKDLVQRVAGILLVGSRQLPLDVLSAPKFEAFVDFCCGTLNKKQDGVHHR